MTSINSTRSGTPRNRVSTENLSPEDKKRLVVTGFDAANRPLEELKHPNPSKRHLKAVSSVPILPDERIWGNDYHLYRFPDAQPQEEAQRGEHALLRRVEMPDGEVRMAYYLLSDQESVQRLQQAQQTKATAFSADPYVDHSIEDEEQVGRVVIRPVSLLTDMHGRPTSLDTCESTKQPTANN